MKFCPGPPEVRLLLIYELSDYEEEEGWSWREVFS